MSLYHASSRIGVGNRVKISYCRLRCILLTLPKNTEHGIFPRRASSTSSSSSFNDDDKSFAPRLNQSDFEREWKLLYHRNPSRNTSPRAFFGISTFNLLYWAWYVFDFTPAINSAAQTKFELGKIDPETLQMLLIDTNIGYIGMGVSSVIWLGAFLYSRQLVSAIWATQPPEDEEVDCRLAVATLKLPFLTQPTILLKTVYDPESNNFDGSVEDIRFTDSDIMSTPSVEIFAPGDLALCEDKIQHDAIVRYDGDFRRLRGHIALKKTNENTEKKGPIAELLEQKFLMDISSAEEVMPNASSTLRYHLFSRDYRLSSSKRKVHIGTKKSGDTDSSAMTSDGRRRRVRNSDLQRPVSQLEMARGILNESMRSKPGK
jgi:hypothetical protein